MAKMRHTGKPSSEFCYISLVLHRMIRLEHFRAENTATIFPKASFRQKRSGKINNSQASLLDSSMKKKLKYLVAGGDSGTCK